MNRSAFDIGFNDVPESPEPPGRPDLAAGPDPGWRDLAETLWAIIEADDSNWDAVRAQPGGCRAATPRSSSSTAPGPSRRKLDLADQPEAASVRYQILAHAAGALSQTTKDPVFSSETATLQTLRRQPGTA
jgi:hypothetical protein